ncbi:hypothetical protein DDB_G0283935 [Dictyostelium discoideum AX4]|uniref:Short-chain dehydrogenase/reductase family protein n=1 Tax=Dictyostelium discoideum TaxID=44689 RepID=Q54QC9_DICDI|nr:hypothetical protein DDB_G0283935 [Dictyostelium discoideum AX4]EAL65455.1 hypothetical protein DDB_G0283935 [Dictyostelium discoideum AX4]|eukprot:XP_638815.1 hypothetical protein DDB_G0283935 [Dictyostelium discoideum AX4]
MSNTSSDNYKVWFITGVTGGAGKALASRLLEIGGYKVAGTSRSKEKLNSLDGSLISNKDFLRLQVNLIDEKNVKESIEETIKKFGKIDIIVNNAGQSIFGSVEEITDKEQRLLMDVLYFGPCNVIRSVLPHFRKRKSGLIFNISSVIGGDPTNNVPFFSGYCAGKSAIHSMTQCLREEVKQFNINVCCILLGYLKTSFSSPLTTNQIKDYNLKEKANDMNKQFQNNTPESPINFANFIIENSKHSNIPQTIQFGKNPYHNPNNSNNPNNNNKPSYPHQKVRVNQDLPKQFDKDIANLPELTDGNIHMPYILHE